MEMRIKLQTLTRSRVGEEETQDARREDIEEEAGCAVGWTYFPHTCLCYKYLSARKTWAEARAHCHVLSSLGYVEIKKILAQGKGMNGYGRVGYVTERCLFLLVLTSY